MVLKSRTRPEGPKESEPSGVSPGILAVSKFGVPEGRYIVAAEKWQRCWVEATVPIRPRVGIAPSGLAGDDCSMSTQGLRRWALTLSALRAWSDRLKRKAEGTCA